MKKSRFLLILCVSFLAMISFSCQTVKAVLGEPSISMDGIVIKSIDFEGITFTCNYSITNPYPLGISLKQVSTDIKCEDKEFTKLSTNDGLTIAARRKSSNKMDFKIPYTAIMNFAKGASGKKSLPFSLDGAVVLDVSALANLGISELAIPFQKDFDVPVFKPEFSVSDARVVLPSLNELTKSFTNSGIGIAKAAQLAAVVLSGQKLSSDIFDGIDLNLEFICNLNVKNSGNAAWKFDLTDCSFKSDFGDVISATPAGKTSVTSSSGTIPLKVSINTLKAGALAVQLINKSGKNPVLRFESSLSFPETKYAPNIPLRYEHEIQMNKVKVSN